MYNTVITQGQFTVRKSSGKHWAPFRSRSRRLPTVSKKIKLKIKKIEQKIKII